MTWEIYLCVFPFIKKQMYVCQDIVGISGLFNYDITMYRPLMGLSFIREGGEPYI